MHSPRVHLAATEQPIGSGDFDLILGLLGCNPVRCPTYLSLLLLKERGRNLLLHLFCFYQREGFCQDTGTVDFRSSKFTFPLCFHHLCSFQHAAYDDLLATGDIPASQSSRIEGRKLDRFESGRGSHKVELLKLEVKGGAIHRAAEERTLTLSRLELWLRD